MLRGLLKYIVLALLLNSTVHAESLDQDAVNGFVEYMVKVYQFDAAALKNLFDNTHFSQRVLDAMEKPAEALPWYKYRPIFVDPDRIEDGRLFWEQYHETLRQAEIEFGVPAGIVVAIIGVETRYGKNIGRDRVMDALATLAFHAPKRAGYFRDELEQFLLLAREQGVARSGDLIGITAGLPEQKLGTNLFEVHRVP